jgi:RNA-directed DNA polymerase
MIIVRYADDIVVGFEHEADARRFRDAMRARLGSRHRTGLDSR